MKRARTLAFLLLIACGGTPTTLNVVIENDGSAGDDASIGANDGGAPDDAAVDGAALDGSTPDATVGSAALVFGSTNYSAGNPGMNANAAPQHAGQTPLQGKNCFQAGGCHSESGVVYAFMGTVFDSPTGTTGVKNAEVRVVSSTGATLASVYTDDDGNFWMPGALDAGAAYVGVRTFSATRVQTAPLSGETQAIACNSSACHGSSSRIHVP